MGATRALFSHPSDHREGKCAGDGTIGTDRIFWKGGPTRKRFLIFSFKIFQFASLPKFAWERVLSHYITTMSLGEPRGEGNGGPRLCAGSCRRVAIKASSIPPVLPLLPKKQSVLNFLFHFFEGFQRLNPNSSEISCLHTEL